MDVRRIVGLNIRKHRIAARPFVCRHEVNAVQGAQTSTLEANLADASLSTPNTTVARQYGEPQFTL
jgi:hypothetical protein